MIEPNARNGLDNLAHAPLDTAIRALAAGALAVSIGFVRDVAPKPTRTFWLGPSCYRSSSASTRAPEFGSKAVDPGHV